MHNQTILVTGASGFVGQALIRTLCQQGYEVRGTVRSATALSALKKSMTQFNNLSLYKLGDLSDTTDWSEALCNTHTVVHCAARAHILNETSTDPLKEFRQVNCEASKNLAEQAKIAGIKRIIFISSIGVLGNTSQDIPFSDCSTPNPKLPYAQSKLEAEHCLSQFAKDMELVIIRPPLVYGPGVKGNFKKLLQYVAKGLPLPLGKINNKRQFIGIDNLVHFIIECIISEKAANHTFTVADNETITTTQLIKTIAKLMDKKIILLPIPKGILGLLLKAVGKENLADQLINNLEINPNNAREILNWKAPFTLYQQLENTIKNEAPIG
ncbi:MAG: NAD-dependent epimerase/dehydratase family protein [Legionella sp.]|nr:NAD-dependent epimerase/dehydratase family protein [Legionella sp.]